MEDISTVILAAGKSTRFKGNNSKLLQDLAGLPIICHVFNLAKKISCKNIIIVCNKKNINEFKSLFSDCKFVIQEKQNGTADAIKSAKRVFAKFNGKLLILYGDEKGDILAPIIFIIAGITGFLYGYLAR